MWLAFSKKKPVISRKISSPGASAMCFGLDGAGNPESFRPGENPELEKKSVMLGPGPRWGYPTIVINGVIGTCITLN